MARYLWTRTRVPTYARFYVWLLAANPEFRRSLLMPHALANRAVCQPLQVALSNKWSWVRADNTGHVDLVNLGAAEFFKVLTNRKRFPRRNE